MKRGIAGLLAGCICLCCLVRSGWAGAAEDVAVPEAAASILMEAETGTVLQEQNAHVPLSIEMMAKLMTVLLAAECLENGTWMLDTPLTASDSVRDTKGAVIWLVPGETMSVEDLLKGVIIGNANDAAAVLAEGVSGSIDRFVQDMNARAFDLGMRDTVFTSPQGYADSVQQTSAYDLALLCRALQKQTAVMPYFSIWRDFLRGEGTELVSENTMTRTYEGHIGFKACHTEQSGWHLAEAASRDHMTCIAVVLGCKTEEDRYALAKSLLRSGFSGYRVTIPGFSAENMKPVAVRGGLERGVLVDAQQLSGLVVPTGSRDLNTVLVLPLYVWAPVRKGQVIGRIAFYDGDTLLYETNLVATHAVEAMSYSHAMARLLVKMLKI